MMLLISTLGYSQSQQTKLQNDSNTVVRSYTVTTTPNPVKSQPAQMEEKNSTQYPVTRIYDGDTVVIMTLQQGKDMNKRFVLLRDSIKSQKFSFREKYNIKEWLQLVVDENPNRLEATPGKLLPIIIKAIQQLADKIDELNQKLQ